MGDRLATVAALLREAGETHHLVYRIVDGDDPDWASWYADWLLDLSEAAAPPLPRPAGRSACAGHGPPPPRAHRVAEVAAIGAFGLARHRASRSGGASCHTNVWRTRTGVTRLRSAVSRSRA